MNQLTEQAKQLSEILKKSELSIVTAESCTGGGLAECITRIPGSSNWFERGFVTYSNASKQELLGVPGSIINDFGAVSEETAIAMAEGALENSHADISIAITGIAGPDGGSNEKPVGTVCFAWAMRNRAITATMLRFDGDREKIRSLSIMTAMRGIIDLVDLNQQSS